MFPPYFSANHLGILLLYPTFLILSLCCKIFFWIRFVYLHRSTLAHIPGPGWAAWTRLWIVKTLASGKSAEVFVQVNKRYGPLARIGPNHILTNNPDVTRRILAPRSGYTRGPWYDSIRIDPHAPNVVSERDERKHTRLKNKLSASFTAKTFSAVEAIVDKRLCDWLYRINLIWRTKPTKLRSFDIGKRIQFLTMDIMADLCLGKAFGCVSQNKDEHEFLATVRKGSAVSQQLSILLEFNSLIYYLTKIPMFFRLLLPQPSDESGIGRIMGIVRETLERRRNSKETPGTDMLQLFLDKGVSEKQIGAEIVVTLVAGSDTTSTAVQSTLLAIVLNPRIHQRLNSEIQKAVAEGRISFPIQDLEARKLKYLRACVLEGLRKFPPVSQLRERVVPPAGDAIDGYRIPGGTFIGFNAWGTQLDRVFGEDPEEFRPERWLINDQDQLKKMHQTHELIFGYGSTKCLGVPMAMMELNKVIFEMFRNFDIEIANPYKPWSSLCYGVFFQEDFNVHLTPVTKPLE